MLTAFDDLLKAPAGGFSVSVDDRNRAVGFVKQARDKHRPVEVGVIPTGPQSDRLTSVTLK